MLAAGVNVAFGSDDVMDPWFPMGTANPLQVAHTGVVAAQLTGQAEIAEAFSMVSSRGARVMGLGDAYGLEVGRPANLVVIPAASPMDAVRRQVRPQWVVAQGRLVASRPTEAIELSWLGEQHSVDFVRDCDSAAATWRHASLREGRQSHDQSA